MFRPDPAIWAPVPGETQLFTCLICQDSLRHSSKKKSNMDKHLNTSSHKAALLCFNSSRSSPPPFANSSSTNDQSISDLSSLAIQELLSSLAGNSQPRPEVISRAGSPDSFTPNFFHLDENIEFQSSPDYSDVQAIAQSLQRLMELGPDDINSDDELEERAGGDPEEHDDTINEYFSADGDPQPEVIDPSYFGVTQKIQHFPQLISQWISLWNKGVVMRVTELFLLVSESFDDPNDNGGENDDGDNERDELGDAKQIKEGPNNQNNTWFAFILSTIG
ncbi:hypothetical protein C8J56DRAFT_1034429 [Mycena floridula]|nr:hypothetical protein C8J56DRAFT_1034429 [Mycena floridula]